jgi:hypothetical protein
LARKHSVSGIPDTIYRPDLGKVLETPAGWILRAAILPRVESP